MSNQNSNIQFKRKTYAKGFNNHKGLDDFIQNSLDKYQFVDPREEMYEATGEYSKYIVSNKSAIPDLVIWNKKFNKNECFYGADTKEYNSFPRFKFILRAKPPNIQGKNNFSRTRESKTPLTKEISSTSISNNKFKNNTLEEKEVGAFDEQKDIEKFKKIENVKYDPYDEDEEPQWVDVDVTEFENVKMVFKGLPGKEFEEASEKFKIETASQKFPSQKEKVFSIKEEISLQDESHDDHLEKIIRLQITSEDEKTNDNIILKDEKELTMSLNSENLFNLNFDLFVDKKPMENFQMLFNNEKGKDLITLEKNSLFEKDFTFIFKSSDENRENERENTKHSINNDQEEILHNLQKSNNDNKKQIYQIEQSTNILFENNIFEKDSNKNETENQLDDVKKPQNYFMLTEDEEEDQKYLFNPNLNQQNSILTREKNLMNTNSVSKQMNLNIRIGMPFNLPQNPNMIPIPIHPMNMMNNFGNFEEFNQKENLLLKNQMMKNNHINQGPVINPIFLENPTSIVQKNMYIKGWLLMTINDKILGQFNSIDLFKYLDKKIYEGWVFENTWITDYETDMYFTPSNLYEILKEIIPNMIGNTINKNKMPQVNFGNFNMNTNANRGPLNPHNFCPNINPNMNFNPIHFNLPTPMNMRAMNLNTQSEGNNGGNISSSNTNNNMLRVPPMNIIQNGNPNMMRVLDREDNMNTNMNMNMNMNMMNQFPFGIDPRFQNIPNMPNIQNIPKSQNIHSNFKNNQVLNFPNNIPTNIQPPLNMNINLQLVKNNINLNNIMLNNNNNTCLNSNVPHPSQNKNELNINSTSTSNNNLNKPPVMEKTVPGLRNKDLSKNNYTNNESSAYNSQIYFEKNNNPNNNAPSSTNNRSTNHTKRKNNFIK